VRIRADRDDLADVFTRANRAVGSRSALPVLQGVLCDVRGGQVRVTGTDLEVTIRTSTEVEVLEEGSVVIPARLATEAIRRMPAGAVTIGATDTEIEILGRGPRFTLRPLALADFPDLGEVAGGGIAVDGDQLAAAIAQVTVAASTDAGRPVTNVVWLTTVMLLVTLMFRYTLVTRTWLMFTFVIFTLCRPKYPCP